MTEVQRPSGFEDPKWAPVIEAGLLLAGDHMDETHIDAVRPDGTIIPGVEVSPITIMDGQATYLIPTDKSIIVELIPPQPRRI